MRVNMNVANTPTEISQSVGLKGSRIPCRSEEPLRWAEEENLKWDLSTGAYFVRCSRFLLIDLAFDKVSS